jgi:hypothetical protein
MLDFLEKDLTEEETDALITKAATEIRRRKMQVPAIVALEMHKPLGYIAANASVAMAPFLIPILGFDFVNDYSRLIAKRENIERLLKMLEEPAKKPAAPTEDPCPT